MNKEFEEFYNVYKPFFEYLSEVRGQVSKYIIHYCRTGDVLDTSFEKYTKDERYMQFYALFERLFDSNNKRLKRLGLDLPVIHDKLSREKALFETLIENFKVIRDENPDNEKLEINYHCLYDFFVDGLHYSFISQIISKNKELGGEALREYSREYYGSIGRMFNS